jgi:hypothetical protein
MQNQIKENATEFYHWSRVPILNVKLDYRTYKQNQYLIKPVGLWFSKNYEWIDWCESEGFGYSRESSCAYQLEINFTNVLVINTIEKLSWLKSKYKIYKNIDWNRVATDYDGIYFDNYYEIKSHLITNKLFNEYLWYFGIDVNSGCIFNCRIIKNLFQVN